MQIKRIVMLMSLLIVLSVLGLGRIALAAVEVTAEPNLFDNRHYISTRAIEPMIRKKLERHNVAGDIAIKLDRDFEKGIQLNFPSESYQASVEALDVDRLNSDFSAMLYFKGSNSLEKVTITGHYQKMVEVPVLVSRIAHKTVIDHEHIAYIMMPEEELQHDTVMDADEIIGLALRRNMRANLPMRSRDIIQPQVIARNQVVDMYFINDVMELRALGVALEDGSRGDVIRVRNSQSNKVIQAIAVEKNRVEVLASQNHELANVAR